MKNKQLHIQQLLPHFLKKIVMVSIFIVFAVTLKSQTLTIIANQKGAPASLTFSELRSILRGEKQRWESGPKVVIALMKTTNNLGKTICEKIYDMKPDELNKYWLALVFQGKVSAPYTFNSTGDLQNFIAQNPGAIGVTDETVNNQDIKTVIVDGKKSL